MNLLKSAIVIVAASLAAPAAAQVGGYEGEQLVAAIAKGDNDTGLSLLGANPTLANARGSDGGTPLLAAIENRDEAWTGYLLRQGANPNLAHRRTGDTPLIAAARIGFDDAVRWLIGLDANVNEANKMGETPLIVAVQRRHVPVVRALLDSGADPDQTDSAAGYSARDYAKRDTRTPELLRLIEAKKPNP